MKNIFFLISISLLSIWGCASGSKVVTPDSFSQISVGMTTAEVEKKLGKPYSIKNLEDNEIQYTYIEKMPMGKRVVQERHYLINFRNNKVSATKVMYYNRPSYEGNSYEMQTSLNEDKQETQNK